LRHRRLARQHRPLAGRAPAVAAEFAAGAQYAVAGYQAGDRVMADGGADRAVGAGMADRFGQGAVADDTPCRDSSALSYFLPALLPGQANKSHG